MLEWDYGWNGLDRVESNSVTGYDGAGEYEQSLRRGAKSKPNRGSFARRSFPDVRGTVASDSNRSKAAGACRPVDGNGARR